MDISRLHLVMAEKVSQQSELIDQNRVLAEQAHVYTDTGNEEMRKANQRSLTFRTYVTLFILICTFAVLYLHAIN